MSNSETTDSRSAPNILKNQKVKSEIVPFDQRGQGLLFPVAETEVDGIQMGVLSDGTPYLTMRGLARMCGIDNTALLRLANNWSEEKEKPRGRRIQELLDAQGYKADYLYIKTQGQSTETHAYTDAVCMAILEYYAFESAQGAGADIAIRNYRILARDSFRTFIYKRCHFDPATRLSDGWRNFHDRVSLTYNAVPAGFFGIFKEIADMIVTLGQAGLHIDSRFVPDISVGIGWASHWKKINGDQQYGERSKFEHNYPDYFPQSASNPQEPWCYPENALGEFRRWFRETYVGEGKLKNYLATAVEKKQLPANFANAALIAYERQ